MSQRGTYTQIDGIDWPAALPALRLMRSFRMAIQPAKMLLALFWVVAVAVLGRALALPWGEPIFTRFARAEAEAFGRLTEAALSLDFGAGALLLGEPPRGALEALYSMVWALPMDLAGSHPVYAVLYGIATLLVTALIGGAVARLAAVQACRGQTVSLGTGLNFAARHYAWFVLTPLLPIVMALILALLLAIVGAILFNLPVLEILGAVLLGPLLALGFVLALLIIGLTVGGHLFYPALAVEGSDGFDAVSRAFNYVLGRPWRYLFYTGVLVVYGTITYLFVALVVLLTLHLTRGALGWWVAAELAGQSRLEAVVPGLGTVFTPEISSEAEGSASATIAAGVAQLWLRLLAALLPAYVFSFYFTGHTWLYLLLRRAADGTELDDFDTEDQTSDEAETGDRSEEAN